MGAFHIRLVVDGEEATRRRQNSPSQCSCRKINVWKFYVGVKRSDLEHILRASKGITGKREVVVMESLTSLLVMPRGP